MHIHLHTYTAISSVSNEPENQYENKDEYEEVR